MSPTPEAQEQHRKILELPRTRNLGGGQQGVMEWRGSTKPASEIPLSGDVFDQAFGVGGIDEPLMPTRESYSRRMIEWAIGELSRTYPREYLALVEVFDADVGGYNDLEWYEERRPEIARLARRGVWLLVAKLPPGRVRLYVEERQDYTEEELEAIHKRHAGVFGMWVQGVEAGEPRHELVERILDTYGISERKLEQIVEQESSLEAQAEEGRVVSREKIPL